MSLLIDTTMYNVSDSWTVGSHDNVYFTAVCDSDQYILLIFGKLETSHINLDA